MVQTCAGWSSRFGLLCLNTIDWGAYQQQMISHRSGGWKSQITVPAALVSGVAFLLDLQTSIFLLCPHLVFSLWLCIPALLSSSYKDSSPIGLRPHLILITSFTALSPNAVTLGLRLQHTSVGGDIIQSITEPNLIFVEQRERSE